MAIIFGRTITEVKKSISYAEFLQWLSYRKKYGPMNDVRRYDRPAAILASILSQVNGGKLEPKDFMPFGADDKVASIDDLVQALGGVKIGKPR